MSEEGLDVGVELAEIGVLVQREAILDRYAGDGDSSVLQLGSGKGDEDVDMTVHTLCSQLCTHNSQSLLTEVDINQWYTKLRYSEPTVVCYPGCF